MATLVLQAAGVALGGLLGPVGAAVGGAAGSMAGYLLDRALINSTLHYKGTRLSAMQAFTAEEGAGIKRVYGTMRVSGTLIWATRFEEKRRSTRQGVKGGAKTTTYSYFANAAFGLCEGPIAGVRRVWADGNEIDLTQVDIRIHLGTPGQMPDTLIEAKQGAGNTPAYRGIAYAVVERLPLDEFGNRMPQLQFEVLRPVGGFHSSVRAITLIPGSTEFGLGTSMPVPSDSLPNAASDSNRHVLFAQSDIEASLDELAMLCPNLTNVALVVSWYGDDLRAGECQVYPAVTASGEAGSGWRVSGRTRADARLVSRHEGAPAYGGTPSDNTVLQAISAIRARGWNVTLYPFVMMDVPAGSGLPDPYGGAEQAAYPWRGRITCYPGPGTASSADVTAAARAQVAAFCGSARASDFTVADGQVDFAGASDWGYRRMVLHYAHLAAAAGGVDAFLIGSELRGLTTLRDGANGFPFVEELVDLAAEVRSILGSQTALTYAADWSEYFGYHPQDGTGDVFFHLDPLWASDDIDAVGIDNYMPLSDWRDEDHAGSNPDGFLSPCDRDGLRSGIASGEGFDWFYADDADRLARVRTPITDGLAGKPWVFRYKDLKSWWGNAHHERTGGIEHASSTDWIACGKPIWFTELGCAAVDKGPNQPNVFADPKSSENALPHFSNGGRSDLAQRRFLEAHFDHWDAERSGFVDAGNPHSPVYGGRMVDAARIHLWAWDVRPYPAFPLDRDIWADGGNWLTGHWLNGRMGAVALSDLVEAIAADHGVDRIEAGNADGFVHGYALSEPGTARDALSPLVELFDLSVAERGGALAFRSIDAGEAVSITDPVAGEDGHAALERVRSSDQELPSQASVTFTDPMSGHQAGSALAVDTGARAVISARLDFPGCLEVGQAEALASDWLRRARGGRETISFATAASDRTVLPGTVVQVPAAGAGDYLVTAVEDGLTRRIEARRVFRTSTSPDRARLPSGVPSSNIIVGRPLVIFLDLPISGSQAAEECFCVAAYARPWKSQQVLASPGSSGFEARVSLTQPAVAGELTAALGPGFEGRIDRAGAIEVRLAWGELAGVSITEMLNGANAAAIRSADGGWEVVQFAAADEISSSVWRLTGLLRGQLGTGDAAASGAAPGASFVLLDQAVQAAGLKAAEIGLPLNWKVGPSGYDMTDRYFVTSAQMGGLRASLPLSPVHLRARRHGDGSIAVNWIRRGRVDADSWLGEDIPLGEDSERYSVRVAQPGGATMREETTIAPQWTYSASAIADDFPERPASVAITVRQLSLSVGEGLAATIVVDL